MASKYQEMITLLLTTRNRPPCLQRVLNYYKRLDSPILVVDGSDAPFDGSPGGAFVRYFHNPVPCRVKRILPILDKIDTPYVCFASDDDYLNPSFLEQAVGLLEKDRDVSSVFGRYYGFDDIKAVSWKRLYKNKESIASSSFTERMKSLFYDYSFVYHSPTRTSLLKEAIHDLSFLETDRPDHAILFEIMHAAKQAIEGKILKIDTMHIVRELSYRQYPTLQQIVAENEDCIGKLDGILKKWAGSSCDDIFMRCIYNPFNAPLSRRNILRFLSKLMAFTGWNASISDDISPEDISELEKVRAFLFDYPPVIP